MVLKRLKGVGANVTITQGVLIYSLPLLGCNGSNLYVGYGLTETSPTVFLLPVPDADGHVGSTGVLLPNLELRLVGEEEGEVSTLPPASFRLA